MKDSKYEIVIGLEVHIQLLTNSKAYASDSTIFGADPNTQISPLSLGHPGTLPFFNEKVVEMAVKLGLATNCKITRYNTFARKNYFYADLPKGYQITQDKTPICTDGFVNIKDENGNAKVIELERIHMEEDAGKSIHDRDIHDSLIDYNRCGVPLLEMVTRPDFRSSQEAYNFLTEVRKLVRYLDICDGNMEEGSMRCDANISIREKGNPTLGVKVEVKNMNSIRNVQRAIEHEFKRQEQVLNDGGKLSSETRSFDATNGTTFSMRSKELANDYRYFPEPDLLPLIVEEEYVNEVKGIMPELPEHLLIRYIKDYSLSEYDALLLVDDKQTSQFFNELVTKTANYKAAANWLLGPIRSFLNANAKHIDEFEISKETIADLIKIIDEGKVSFSAASQSIFTELCKNPSRNPEEIAKELNLIQTSDENYLNELIISVIAKYPEKVEEYRNGKKGLMGLFVGEVMKLSGGKADPKLTNQLVKNKLETNE